MMNHLNTSCLSNVILNMYCLERLLIKYTREKLILALHLDPNNTCTSFGNVRTTRSTINNLSTDSNSSLLLVYDDRSGKYFLVDTGSALSIIPPKRSDTRKTSSHYLIAANGSPIKTFGTRQMMLNLGLQKYLWHFIRRHPTYHGRRFPSLT